MPYPALVTGAIGAIGLALVNHLFAAATPCAAMAGTCSRLVYNVQELSPGIAVKVGVLRAGSALVRFLERVERFVYHRAHALAVICQAFAEAIVAKASLPGRSM